MFENIDPENEKNSFFNEYQEAIRQLHGNGLLKKEEFALLSKMKTYFFSLKEKLDFYPYISQKQKTFQHKEKAIVAWRKYYKNIFIDKKHHLSVFYNIMKKYGLPDVKNTVPQSDNDYFNYHQEYLFFTDVQNLLGFLKADSIYREIDDMIDEFKIYQQAIEKNETIRPIYELAKRRIFLEEKIEKVRNEFLKEAEKRFHQDFMVNHYNESMGNVDLNSDVVLNYCGLRKLTEDYKKTHQEIDSEYSLVVRQYEELEDKFSLTLEEMEAVEKVEEWLSSANVGLLMLLSEDMFIPDVYRTLSWENLILFFGLSILFSNEKLWQNLGGREKVLKKLEKALKHKDKLLTTWRAKKILPYEENKDFEDPLFLQLEIFIAFRMKEYEKGLEIEPIQYYIEALREIRHFVLIDK